MVLVIVETKVVVDVGRGRTMDGGVGLAELIGLEVGAGGPVVAAQRYNGDKGGVALGGAVGRMSSGTERASRAVAPAPSMVCSNQVELPC